jgi:hypothetical protein
MVPQYQNLLSGTEILESQLRDTFPEYLNAEIVLRNVVDVQGAIKWLKSTFLYVRVIHKCLISMLLTYVLACQISVKIKFCKCAMVDNN